MEAEAARSRAVEDEGNTAPPGNPPAPAPGEQDCSKITGQAAGTLRRAGQERRRHRAGGIVSGKDPAVGHRQGPRWRTCRRTATSTRLISTPSTVITADRDPRPRPRRAHHRASARRRGGDATEGRDRHAHGLRRRPAVHRDSSAASSSGCRCGRCAGSRRPPPASPSSRSRAGRSSLPERVPDADPKTEVGQVGAAFNRMLGHVGGRADPKGGERGAAAPVRRRRQPRAAHAAGGHPWLRRAGPAPSRPGPRGHRARARPG